MADQAAGLRRLISRDFVRILALASAHRGSGVSFITAQFAAALGLLGREACVLRGDEGAQQVSRALLPMIDAAGGDSARLAQSLEQVRAGAEIVLLDLPSAPLELQARIAACAPDVLVVLQARQSHLRESYALIKRISSVSGKCRLHVLFNRSDDTEHARRIFGNLAATSDRFLSQPIEFLGVLPHEDRASHGVYSTENFIEMQPHSNLSRMLRALAERILLWPYPGENDMSGFARRLVAALPGRSE